MKVRHIMFGIILALFVTGPVLAQTSNTTTNTNNGSFQSGFGFGGSFSFVSSSNSNVRIRQEVSDTSFSQCFSLLTTFGRLVQMVTGSSMSQMYVSVNDPDPCL